MKPTTQLEEARKLLGESVEEMHDWDAKIQALPEDADEKEVVFHRDCFEAAQTKNQRYQETVERLEAIQSATKRIPDASEDNEENGGTEERDQRPGARPRGSSNEPRTYTADSSARGTSFFRDLMASKLNDDYEARGRLERHLYEDAVEKRAGLNTTVNTGGTFVPPAYLGELWAEFPRQGRPFADAVPSQPLRASGMSITVPRLTGGTAVSNQTEAGAVQMTDAADTLLTVPVRTIAGQQEISQQLVDRSDPGIDQIIFNDLRGAYDARVDQQCIAGLGTGVEHLGIRAVSSINTSTFTSGSPTAALAVPKIYDAIQLIASNRLQPADLIVMHPRRAAWLASSLSSTFPLFQVGGLYQGVGSQDQGMMQGISGLRVVLDANIATNYGASTTEDEIYVVRSTDLILMESDLQARVMPEVLSNTLQVRIQLFAYSAFVSGRQPKSISKIAGTGLIAPTF